MADKDQNNQSTELEELAKDNQKLKNDVTLGQKYLMWIIIALSVVAVIVLIYIFAVRQPGVKASNEAISQADITLSQGNDSLALAQYQQVADEYGYEAGSRAASWLRLSIIRRATMRLLFPISRISMPKRL